MGFVFNKNCKKKRPVKEEDDGLDKLFLAQCLLENYRVGAKNFFNADQTFWLDVNLRGYTMTYKGAGKPTINYKVMKKKGFSLMLCINANGDMLSPIVIKPDKPKRTFHNLELPQSFTYCYSNNGWINLGILKVLFKQINDYTNNTPSVLLS